MKLTVAFFVAFGMLSGISVLADSPGPSANPYRAYPPSCLADPLPAVPSGPSWTAAVTVPAEITGTSQFTTEDVALIFWRTPCSGGTSALLGLFQRSPANNGRQDVIPEFPAFIVTQGAATFPARLAMEPNTIRSALAANTPLSFNEQFVFENFPTSAAPQFNFSLSVGLEVVGASSAGGTIPAYDSSQYAGASLPLPITGYLTANWFDPAHSGEGIQTEIGELAGSTNNRYITVAWYTFDSTGTPYWLFGSGIFTAGDRSASFQIGYSTNGGFAGNFGASAPQALWGIFNVQFPNCNTMQFSYQSTSGLPSGVPVGTGSKSWTRLSTMNGLACG